MLKKSKAKHAWKYPPYICRKIVSVLTDMHLFRKYIGSAGILRYKEGMFKACMLGCVVLLLAGHSKSAAVGHILGLSPTTHAWKTDSNPGGIVPCFTAQHPAKRVTLDFENVLEPDPGPGGEGGQGGKDAKTGVYPVHALHLLVVVEQHRTKSTLAHCTTSLHRRVRLPLFILYHNWKDFPA